MTTATAINLDNVTTGEAHLVLDRVIKQIANQTGEILIANDDVAIVAYALENNLQLRDYLMGLTSDGLSVESITNILRVLSVLIKSAELPAYTVETVLAYYMYRLGDSDALAMLESGLARDYSLAILLGRVMSAGFPASAFAAMSQELHPKVIAELTSTQELLVNESLRDSE